MQANRCGSRTQPFWFMNRPSPVATGAMSLALAVFTLASRPALAQIAISTLSGGPYTQNFDSLSNSPALALVNWVNNSTLPGWYAARQVGGSFTNYEVDTGAVLTGRMYSYGSTNGVNPVTDRALGLLGSGTPKATAFGVRFTNDTANALSNFTVSFAGEQWRSANGTGSVTNILSFWYRTTNSPIT